MLGRKMMERLRSWKESRKSECLLVKDTRQVGRFFIIERFGAPYKSACCNVRPLSEGYDVDMTAFGEKFSYTGAYVDSATVKKVE